MASPSSCMPLGIRHTVGIPLPTSAASHLRSLYLTTSPPADVIFGFMLMLTPLFTLLHIIPLCAVKLLRTGNADELQHLDIPRASRCMHEVSCEEALLLHVERSYCCRNAQ